MLIFWNYRSNSTLRIINITFSSRNHMNVAVHNRLTCLLYTSDAADEEDSVDLGGRRILKKKNRHTQTRCMLLHY